MELKFLCPQLPTAGPWKQRSLFVKEVECSIASLYSLSIHDFNLQNRIWNSGLSAKALLRCRAKRVNTIYAGIEFFFIFIF